MSPKASTCLPQDEPTSCAGHESCLSESAASAAMHHLFDVVGAEIHALDPTHLVESGMLEGGQCGTSGADYTYVSASPGIDVPSYHDSVVGGDRWNGIALRLSQAAALGNPIIAGETGIMGGTAPECTSLANRADEIAA